MLSLMIVFSFAAAAAPHPDDGAGGPAVRPGVTLSPRARAERQLEVQAHAEALTRLTIGVGAATAAAGLTWLVAGVVQNAAASQYSAATVDFDAPYAQYEAAAWTSAVAGPLMVCGLVATQWLAWNSLLAWKQVEATPAIALVPGGGALAVQGRF